MRILIALGGARGGEKYALPTARAAKIRARRQTLLAPRDYLVPSRRTGNETTSLVIRHSNAGEERFLSLIKQNRTPIPSSLNANGTLPINDDTD